MHSIDTSIHLKVFQRNQRTLNVVCNSVVIVIVMCLISSILILQLSSQCNYILIQEHANGTSFLQVMNIHKPIIDENQYEHLTLMNRIKVLLVHNPKAVMSKVALSVQAGSWQNPEGYEGLAHFLEHMLFEGSSTYPEYFQKVIAQFGGRSNAFTSDRETNYYFQISRDGLQQALGPFSHFFIDPLISEQMIQKEIQAVHNEYERSIRGNMEWDLYHLLQITGDQSHPFTKFSTGNLNTLHKNDSKQMLLDFFEQNYSSNLMALVIESSHSIKELRELTQIFAEIPNKELERPTYTNLESPTQGQRLIEFKFLAQQSINYMYKLPYYSYKSKSLEFVQYLLQSKHKNGLWDYLKANGCEDLNVEEFIEDNNGAFSMLQIQVIGDQHRKIEILQSINGYLNTLLDNLFVSKGSDVKDTQLLKDLWNDLKNIETTKFKYKSQSIDSIQTIAHNLNFYAVEDVLRIDAAYDDFDSLSIYNILADMIDPQNVIIAFAGHNVETEVENQLFNLKYKVTDLSDSELQSITEPITTHTLIFSNNDEHKEYSMSVPSRNTFIPRVFDMKSICKPYGVFVQGIPDMVFNSVEDCLKHESQYEEHYPFPQIIHKHGHSRLWWKLDRQYKVPQAVMAVKFQLDRKADTIHSKVKHLVQIHYVDSQLKQKLQPALEAGYSFQITYTHNGVEVIVSGWEDSFRELVSQVIDQLNSELSDDLQLQQSIHLLKLEYSEFFQKDQNVQIMTHYLPQVFHEHPHHPHHIAEHLKKIDISNLRAAPIEDTKSVLMYATGNILQEEANSLFELVSKEDNQLKHSLIKITKLQGDFILALPSQNKDEVSLNCMTVNYYQFGPRNRRSFATMKLLKTIFNSEAYGYLRTQHQLGYAVSAFFKPMECIDGAFITVQGSALMPFEVDQKIEDYLKQFQQHLQMMTEEQFTQIQESVVTQLKDKPQELLKAAKESWEHIKNQDNLFEEKELTADEVQVLTLSDVNQWYIDTFTEAKKISIQLYTKATINKRPTLNQELQALKIENFSKRPQLLANTNQIRQGSMAYQCTHKLPDL